MSADSPRRGLHKGAQIISPQPISDRSIIDSVAGIINDIVPQAYAGAPNLENKESITWARFEYADVNNSIFYPDYIEGSATPPLLLVLGYTTGVQVWLIAASGEATEVLSWRQGIVRTLRILPDPKTDDDHADPFESKRPLVAICDSAGPGPQFCSVSFVSLRTSEQAKIIKFKNPVCDVLANRRSVVVTLSEKIAVFDARTLEDVLTVTTCYPSPGPNPNPVALGTRWLAYSEKKLLPARRSSGGSEGEGVQSYTAAVLYAAKSLGKGLRGLGETVASSLTGNSVIPMAMNNIGNDVTQPGVVTILDLQSAKEEKDLDDPTMETVVAHFTAHNDAIVAITFDLTGALLMTADKRGHDFHVFRIQPHPGGPTLAAVHHLYVLHRGDTTAKVQDMTFSSDTRWAAVSTVRGTTHVFPVAPYGGPVGVRTHSTPHVVNRLSRFHRSAGLTDDGTRSHSPVSHAELPISVYPYSNPRLPPYPHPTVLHPLAQIRQPSTLNHTNNQTQPSRPQQRQRLHSEDSGTLPLKICACFAPPRAWIYAQRDSTNKVAKRAVDSLFIMACHGNMIQYDLEPKPAAGVPKEKVCDDTTIELEVEAKGQWPLMRTPNSLEIVPPLASSSPLLCSLSSPKSSRNFDTADDRWLSQVEIVTHAGPHRRLWMGPQFVFKTYNAPSGVNLIESEAIEIGVTGGSRPARSNPVNMPHAAARPLVPVVIDGSGSSYEQSPRFVEAYGDSLDNDTMGMGNGENQLREDLAEAMLETSTAPHRAAGRRLVVERVVQPVTKVVNPLGTVITVMADEEDASSSQEYDDATPEPPRSVCAEEGPASLNDFDTEAQDLKNLTEVCAEIRTTNENRNIDENAKNDVTKITDVKHEKTLCVEVAKIANSNETTNTIDYTVPNVFREMPTSLSLCAERGEIPDSPMTLARETNWKKLSAKREDSEMQTRTLAKAKYVVSYDDDSVVLMENKATGKKNVNTEDSSSLSVEGSSRSETTTKKLDNEPERASKRPSKVSSIARANKRSTCGNREKSKYLLHEQGDSIVIEDTTMPENKMINDKKLELKTSKDDSTKKNDVDDFTKISSSRQSAKEISEHCESSTRDKRLRVNEENRDSKDSRMKNDSVSSETNAIEAMIVESRDTDEKCDTIDSFVDVKDLPANFEDLEAATNIFEPMEATMATGSASLPLEDIAVDEISSMDYQIVDATTPTTFKVKEDCPMAGQQSDDDIEHINTSEVVRMLDIVDEKSSTDDYPSSPHRQRKNSKSTVSDDDIEHINTSELVDVVEESPIPETHPKSADYDRKNDPEDFEKFVKTEKCDLTFDEDVEHVCRSEFTEFEPSAVESSTIVETPIAKKISSMKKSQESTTIRNRGSRKRKDVVVIDNENCEIPESTIVAKTHEIWNKSKTPEKDLTDEIDRCVEPNDNFTDITSLQSLPKKTRVRNSKISSSASSSSSLSSSSSTNLQKRASQMDSEMIEIIDIDAMQKAEMNVASESNVVNVVTTDCKIFESRHDSGTTRSSKSRKNKKLHHETSSNVDGQRVVGSMERRSSSGTRKRDNDRSKDVSKIEIVAQTSTSWSSIVGKTDQQRIVESQNNEQIDNREITEPTVTKLQSPNFIVDTSNDVNSSSEIVKTSSKIHHDESSSSSSSKISASTIEVAEKSLPIAKKRGKKLSRVWDAEIVSSTTKSPTKSTSVCDSAILVDEVTTLDDLGQGQGRGSVEVDEATKLANEEVAFVDETPIEDVITIRESTIVDDDDVESSKVVENVEVETVMSVETSTNCVELDKPTDSDQEIQPERSSSSDDLNANVVPMDTEEDVAAAAAAVVAGAETIPRDTVDKSGAGVVGSSPSWSAVNKKNPRSKKKKRR